MRAHEPGLLRPDQARPAGVGALAMADGAWRFLLGGREIALGVLSLARSLASFSQITWPSLLL